MTNDKLKAIKDRTELARRHMKEAGAWEEQLLSDAQIVDLIDDVTALLTEVEHLSNELDEVHWDQVGSS